MHATENKLTEAFCFQVSRTVTYEHMLVPVMYAFIFCKIGLAKENKTEQTGKNFFVCLIFIPMYNVYYILHAKLLNAHTECHTGANGSRTILWESDKYYLLGF